MEKPTIEELIKAKEKFYQKIMTFTIKYGVLRAEYPERESEMIDIENAMREFIKKGLGLK